LRVKLCKKVGQSLTVRMNISNDGEMFVQG
jgi:hypothetical protein